MSEGTVIVGVSPEVASAAAAAAAREGLSLSDWIDRAASRQLARSVDPGGLDDEDPQSIDSSEAAVSRLRRRYRSRSSW